MPEEALAWWWQAALTPSGRAGTTRPCGFGQQVVVGYARNRCLTPRYPEPFSNLVDMGRDSGAGRALSISRLPPAGGIQPLAGRSSRETAGETKAVGV